MHGQPAEPVGKGLDALAKWLLKFRLISIPAKSIANSKLAWSLISRIR